MKKQFALFGVVIAAVVISFSCQKKDNSDSISPTYGSTGNPYPNNQTVTGSTSYTNPATNNSSIEVGNIGWTNPTCFTTGSITLRGYKGNTEVVLSFAQPAITGTYNIASVASGTTACSMQITNAPDQPAGVNWYGKTGIVIVNVQSTSINAILKDVVCTQSTFNFPTVLVSGFLSCGSQ